MSTTFRRLVVGLAAGLSLLVVHTTIANATVSHAAAEPGSATHAPVPGLLPVKIPPAGHALPGRVATLAPADSLGCWDQDALLSIAADSWVSAELGYTGGNYGMLRARANTIGPWERFALCYDYTTSDWVIYSDASGLFVSAELGYTGGNYGMLRARATSIGPWEHFQLTCDAVSGALDIHSIASGYFVSAELGYTGGNYGMLRARSSGIGPWEQYVTDTGRIGC